MNFVTESEVTELPSDIVTELAYLRYFYQEADFGPAHDDVIYILQENYDGEIPDGYKYE